MSVSHCADLPSDFGVGRLLRFKSGLLRAIAAFMYALRSFQFWPARLRTKRSAEAVQNL
jgi:hypothetical protein